MKILIVDDKKENLYLLERIIKKIGYEVVIAENGKQALEKLMVISDILIVISDILMPVMDGFQLCKTVRSNKKFDNVFFVFLTATYTEKEDEDFGLSLGADLFLKKPLEPQKLVIDIKNLIQKKEKKLVSPKKIIIREEKEVLKLYSERLIKKLEHKIMELEKETTKRKKAEINLRERVKELTCLYNISELFEQTDFSLEGKFPDVLKYIPPAWQFPDLICTRIVIGEQEFKTKNFKKTDWKQNANIMVEGKKHGEIEVYYLEEKPNFGDNPFLKEERKLIKSIADLLGRFISHQQVNDQIIESHKWLSTTLKSIGDAVIATDRQGIVQFANPVAESLTNWKQEQAIGKPLGDIFNIINEETRTLVENPVSKVIREGFIIGLANHTILISKNGKEIPIIDSGAPIKDEEGNIIGVILVFRDDTERKKAEKKLKKSENLLKKSQQIAHIGSFEWDLKTNQIELSNEMYNICGITHEQNEKFDFSLIKKIMHPDDVANHEKLFVNAITENKTEPFEFRIIKPDGSERNVISEASIIYDKKRRPVKLLGYVQDLTKQKRIEEALQKSEKRFRNLFENTISGVAIYQAIEGGNDFVFVDFNKASEKIEKIRKENVIGKKVTEVFPGIVDFGLLEVFQRVWKTGKAEEHPISIYKDDRILGWRKNFVYRLPSGEIVAIFSDETERMEAEREVQESYKYAESIVNTIPVPLISLNSDFRVITANRSFYETFKVLSEETEGQLFYDLCDHSWDIPKLRELLETILPKNTKFDNYEVKHNFKTIGKRTLSLSARRIYRETNKTQMIFMMIEDITERKKAEEELYESEEKFRSIVENITDWVWEIDLNGIYTYSSPKIKELLGFKPEEIIGKTPFDFMPKEESERIRRKFSEIVELKKPFYGLENINIHKNGTQITVETRGIPLFDKSGSLLGYRGIHRDITERKKTENLRERFTKKLEEEVKIKTQDLNEMLAQQKLFLKEILKTSQFKSEFMASMSHELRTPLTSIIGFTEMLLDKTYGETNEKQDKFLNNVISSADHLLILINEILDIAKIEAGKADLNIQDVRLINLINQVQSTIKPISEKKGLKFEIEGLEEEKIIKVDPIKFKEILCNLLSNAAKYTKEGGFKLKITEQKGHYVFEIIDTGIGIAKEDFDSIFMEFKRGKSEYVRSIEGTGLGLVLTKKLVELHGGNITFTSEFGKGTTFTFMIPKELKKLKS
ncbi:MAG: PAS domain S-box protein [Promethearchaeota archaeon]